MSVRNKLCWKYKAGDFFTSWTAISFLRKKRLQSVTQILNAKLLYLPLDKRKLKKKNLASKMKPEYEKELTEWKGQIGLMLEFSAS